MNNHFFYPKVHTIHNLSNKIMRLFWHKIIIQKLFFLATFFQMIIKLLYYEVKSSLIWSLRIDSGSPDWSLSWRTPITPGLML